MSDEQSIVFQMVAPLPDRLRFAVLWHHQTPEPHFDLLIETEPGSDLVTWRLTAWPVTEPMAATRLRDHRRIYLQYDGELTEGRGRVDRVASGTHQIERNLDRAFLIHFFEPVSALRLERISGDQWKASPV